jgi:hypothetical protein
MAPTAFWTFKALNGLVKSRGLPISNLILDQINLRRAKAFESLHKRFGKIKTIKGLGALQLAEDLIGR